VNCQETRRPDHAENGGYRGPASRRPIGRRLGATRQFARAPPRPCPGIAVAGSCPDDPVNPSHSWACRSAQPCRQIASLARIHLRHLGLFIRFVRPATSTPGPAPPRCSVPRVQFPSQVISAVVQPTISLGPVDLRHRDGMRAASSDDGPRTWQFLDTKAHIAVVSSTCAISG